MNYKKIFTLFLFTLITGVIFYLILVRVSRIGEVPVSIRAIPKDSEIYINDKKIKSGTNYVSKGEHAFSAKREFFADETKNVVVGEDMEEIVLVLGINSPQARQYFADNPDEAGEREKYFGEEITQRDERIQNNYPVINFLPVDDLSGPFSIDYGTEKDNPEEIFLIVSNSSPAGRIAALKWLRQNGQDPTDLRINFTDFKNPLIEKGQR